LAGNSDPELNARASPKKHTTRSGRTRGIGSGWFVSIVLHAALVFAVSRFVAEPSTAIDAEPEVRTVLDLRMTNFVARAEQHVIETDDLARGYVPHEEFFELLEPDVIDHDLEATLANGANESDAIDAIATRGGARTSSVGSAMSLAKLPKRAASVADSVSSGGAGSPANPTGGVPPEPTIALVAPELLASPEIDYPPRSRRANEEGNVRCRIHISALGMVERVEVLVSSGFHALDEAARVGLARWRFKAGTSAGLPAACVVDHVVTFRLRTVSRRIHG